MSDSAANVPATRVRAIIEVDGKYLLVRNMSSADFWCLPGGKADPGEDVITALEREMIEETGIKPVIGNLVYVHQFKQNGVYNLPEFFFHVTNGRDYLNLDVSQSSHGELELADIGFKELSSIIVRPLFLKDELPDLAAKGFTEPTRFKVVK